MGVSTSDILFNLVRITKAFGPRTLFEDVSLSFLRGARIGVIGPNGMGKSSLLRILAGEDKDFLGEVVIDPGVRVGYVPQEPKLDPTQTVAEAIEDAVKPIRDLLTAFDEISARMGEEMSDDEMNDLLEKMGKLQDEIEAKDAWELDRHVEQAMMALGLPAVDAKVENLSGGEKRRVALCREMMKAPDLLLLDEPTNHLDADTVLWLERHLQDYKGTIILITHDRYFLDNVAGWMLEIDKGQLTPYEGNYSAYLEQRQERSRQSKKAEEERTKLISRELDWVRQNPKGRTAKSKARVQRYDELVAAHKKTVRSEFSVHIEFTQRLGEQVMEVKNLSKSYGDRKLFEGLEFDMPQGAILGVIGPNGAGKTTFMRMVVGQETPDTGSILIGKTVDLCYLDQSRDALVDTNTVYDEITGGNEFMTIAGQDVNGRAYCARFNFRGGDQKKIMRELSGGERNRVLMAKMLARGGNLLMLDEPTNDLDLPTLRHLEEALLEFPGCAVIVTHDRWFLDRIATHILAFEGNGSAVYHPGNYESFREYRRRVREEMGLAADSPVGAHRRFRT